MGLDTYIYFTASPKLDEHILKARMPSGFEIEVADPDGYTDVPTGATHTVDNGQRFYGPNYERGHWPTIACALMTLLHNPQVSKVWYGHDNWMDEISPTKVLEISEHYLNSK